MNAQLLQAILWVLGVAVTVQIGVVTYIFNWCRGIETRIRESEKAQSTFETRVAEGYVRGHEIAEVKKAINDLRDLVTHQMGELTKAVYTAVGQSNSK